MYRSPLLPAGLPACMANCQWCVFLETDFYHVPGRDVKYYNQRVCVSAYVHWYVWKATCPNFMFRAASDHCSVFFVITVQFVLYFHTVSCTSIQYLPCIHPIHPFVCVCVCVFHTVSFTVNYVIIEYEILWQIVLFLAQITIVGLQYIYSSIVTFLS